MNYWKRLMPARVTDFFQLKPASLWHLHKPHMSALVQPPIVAQVVERIYECSSDLNFVRELLSKLKAYYNWIAHNRDFEQEGLLSIISPYESGMDWKASFDPVVGFKGRANWRLFLKVMQVDAGNFFANYNLQKIYRQDRFLVKDAAFNTIYAQSLDSMAKLCELAGDADASIFRARCRQTEESIFTRMYDSEAKAFMIWLAVSSES
ncbi:hypothetical protein LN893_11385 [Pontibacter sp. XAAS-A31]|nr:hypothetical protein [Pontibacter harenae]MCC9167448.1 hypothetical protein [Pontibacter harenae]